MTAVVASEAKLIVRLDTTQALLDAEKIPPGAQAPPPEPPSRVNPGADGPPGDKGPPRGRDGSFAWQQTKDYLRATMRGGLYEQIKSTISTIPIAGTAIKGAELVRDYGPAGTAALKEAVSTLPPGVRETVNFALQASTANTVTREVAARMTKIEVTLQAISNTIDSVKEAAGGVQVLGGLGQGFGEFAYNQGVVNRFQALVGAAARQRKAELLGKALGGISAEGLKAMFSGASGR